MLKPSHDAYHQYQHPANSHFAHCRVWSNKINMKFGLIMQRRRLPLATSRFSHLHSLKEVLAHSFCQIWWHFLSIMLIKWKLVFVRIIYVGRTSGFSSNIVSAHWKVVVKRKVNLVKVNTWNWSRIMCYWIGVQHYWKHAHKYSSVNWRNPIQSTKLMCALKFQKKWNMEL